MSTYLRREKKMKDINVKYLLLLIVILWVERSRAASITPKDGSPVEKIDQSISATRSESNNTDGHLLIAVSFRFVVDNETVSGDVKPESDGTAVDKPKRELDVNTETALREQGNLTITTKIAADLANADTATNAEGLPTEALSTETIVATPTKLVDSVPSEEPRNQPALHEMVPYIASVDIWDSNNDFKVRVKRHIKPQGHDQETIASTQLTAANMSAENNVTATADSEIHESLNHSAPVMLADHVQSNDTLQNGTQSRIEGSVSTSRHPATKKALKKTVTATKGNKRSAAQRKKDHVHNARHKHANVTDLATSHMHNNTFKPSSVPAKKVKRDTDEHTEHPTVLENQNNIDNTTTRFTDSVTELVTKTTSNRTADAHKKNEQHAAQPKKDHTHKKTNAPAHATHGTHNNSVKKAPISAKRSRRDTIKQEQKHDGPEDHGLNNPSTVATDSMTTGVSQPKAPTAAPHGTHHHHHEAAKKAASPAKGIKRHVY